MRDLDKNKDGQITFDEFKHWYESSMFWTAKTTEAAAAAEAAEGAFRQARAPKQGHAKAPLGEKGRNSASRGDEVAMKVLTFSGSVRLEMFFGYNIAQNHGKCVSQNKFIMLIWDI